MWLLLYRDEDVLGLCWVVGGEVLCYTNIVLGGWKGCMWFYKGERCKRKGEEGECCLVFHSLSYSAIENCICGYMCFLLMIIICLNNDILWLNT